MRGNIVLAAAIFGLALVAGCVVLVVGVGMVARDATGRIVTAVERHGDMTSHAGEKAGLPIEKALDRLSAKVDEHGEAVTIAGRSVEQGAVVAGKDIRAGATVAGKEIREGATVAGQDIKEGAVVAGRDISTPNVSMTGPVPIIDQEPLRVQGTAPDRSLPVDVDLGGQEVQRK